MEKTAVLNWDVEAVLEKLRTEKFDLSVIEAFQSKFRLKYTFLS